MYDATTALRDPGMSGLTTWLGSVTSAHPELDIYVVDPSGRDVLRRHPPNRIAQWLAIDGSTALQKVGSNRPHNWPDGCDLAPGSVTPRSLEFNRRHLLANSTITGPDGSGYTLLVAWFDATPADVLSSNCLTLLLRVIALSVSVRWPVGGSPATSGCPSSHCR